MDGFKWTEKEDTGSSSSSDSERSSRKRKHKHEKEKKSKKPKKERKHRRESREKTPDVDVPQPSTSEQLNTDRKTGRDEWMGNSESAFLFPSVSASELKQQSRDAKAAAKAAQQEETAKIYRSRELNPYLREKDEKSEKLAEPVVRKPVGDGGASWLKRSYERLKEQARESGESVEILAAERWGSLDRLVSLIDEADKNERSEHRRPRDYRSERHECRDGRPRHRHTDRDSRKTEEENRTDEDSTRSPRSKRPERPSFDTAPAAKFKFIKPGEEPSAEWKNRDRPSHSSSYSSKSKLKSESVDQSNTVPTMPSGSFAAEVQKNVAHAVENNTDVGTNISQADLNKLNAQILRAEMMGDSETVAQLKAKIAAAQSSQATLGEARRPETVMLSRTHAKGFSYPVQSGPEFPLKGKKPKTVSHNAKGERERYFADDEKYSLQDLVSMERMQSADDQNAMFARLAGTSKEKTDDDYGVDDALMKKALGKETLDQMSTRDRERAIMEHRQLGSALSSCLYCLEGPKVAKHLVISIGHKALLMLPPYTPLTEGHCLICPIQHVSCATQVDEDVWEEMQKFRSAVCRMFAEHEMDCVFMETATRLKSHPHMQIECIPLDKDNGSLAPMYFRKAILEAEGEWTQNKKLVDLSRKGIRSSVPKGLPYFAVDFGMQGGYAHVIENEQKFPVYFGKEVLGGMIDVEPRLWLKNIPQDFNEQLKNVNKFENMWRQYDFTTARSDG